MAAISLVIERRESVVIEMEDSAVIEDVIDGIIGVVGVSELTR